MSDEAGKPFADGGYDFAFALYQTETGAEALWSEVQEGVPVRAGVLSTMLGEAEALPSEPLDTNAQWLEVSVRGPREDDFTRLTPRQR